MLTISEYHADEQLDPSDLSRLKLRQRQRQRPLQRQTPLPLCSATCTSLTAAKLTQITLIHVTLRNPPQVLSQVLSCVHRVVFCHVQFKLWYMRACIILVTYMYYKLSLTIVTKLNISVHACSTLVWYMHRAQFIALISGIWYFQKYNKKLFYKFFTFNYKYHALLQILVSSTKASLRLCLKNYHHTIHGLPTAAHKISCTYNVFRFYK